MTVQQMIEKLSTFDKNLQVCLFIDEYEVYTPDILIEVANKEDDSGVPYQRFEPLQDKFVTLVER